MTARGAHRVDGMQRRARAPEWIAEAAKCVVAARRVALEQQRQAALVTRFLRDRAAREQLLDSPVLLGRVLEVLAGEEGVTANSLIAGKTSPQ